MKRLEGKAAVITGAASGMGRATAKLFAAEGARVLLADVDEQGCAALAAEISAAGGQACWHRVEVSRAADVQAMVERALMEFGALDVLFNNAGIEGESGRIADSSEENFDRVIAVNLKGVFLGMKYAIPVMQQRGGGSIINNASVAGLGGWMGGNAYSASKGGVVTLTKTAALDYARWQIRVNCVCPGVIRTALLERVTGGVDAAMARLQRMQPAPFIGEPEDVAAMVLFLASDEARFVTGAAFTVDGGYTAR